MNLKINSKEEEKEKASITSEADVKDEINKVKTQIEEAERNTDLQRAAELKYGKLLELEKKLKACQNKEHTNNKLLKEEVTATDIDEVVNKIKHFASKYTSTQLDTILVPERMGVKRLVFNALEGEYYDKMPPKVASIVASHLQNGV